MRIIKTTANCETDLLTALRNLSKVAGGAWVYSVLPFTHEVHYSQYKSPSRVPDYHFDGSDGRIGWKGQIVQFTAAARIREQNRAVSCE